MKSTPRSTPPVPQAEPLTKRSSSVGTEGWHRSSGRWLPVQRGVVVVGELPAAAGFPGDLDPVVVHVVAVVPAHQQSGSGVGSPLIAKPVLGMVAFTPARWRGAPRELGRGPDLQARPGREVAPQGDRHDVVGMLVGNQDGVGVADGVGRTVGARGDDQPGAVPLEPDSGVPPSRQVHPTRRHGRQPITSTRSPPSSCWVAPIARRRTTPAIGLVIAASIFMASTVATV